MKTLQTFCIFALSAFVGAQPTTLDHAIRSSRANRPALEAARLRVEQANLARRALGSYPSTRLSLGYGSDPETGGSDDDLVLSQPLDLFGRASAHRRTGTAMVLAAQAGYRQIALEVQSEVVSAYVEAATSSELLRSAQAVQAVYERLYEATKARVDGGIEPGFHLTQVSLDLEQAKLATEQRQAEAEANLKRLSTIMGLDAKAEIGGDLPNLEITDTDDAGLIHQRADLQLLAAEVSAAEAEVGIARLGNMPELELQGRRTPWQEREDRYGLRVQLSIPLFDFGRARSETKSAATKADAARKALADATMLALGEVKAAKSEAAAAKRQVEKYAALVSKAKELVERLRPGLTEHATTLLEVLDATRVLRDLEMAYVESKARSARAHARYLKATGQLLEVTP